MPEDKEVESGSSGKGKAASEYACCEEGTPRAQGHLASLKSEVPDPGVKSCPAPPRTRGTPAPPPTLGRLSSSSIVGPPPDTQPTLSPSSPTHSGPPQLPIHSVHRLSSPSTVGTPSSPTHTGPPKLPHLHPSQLGLSFPDAVHSCHLHLILRLVLRSRSINCT